MWDYEMLDDMPEWYGVDSLFDVLFEKRFSDWWVDTAIVVTTFIVCAIGAVFGPLVIWTAIFEWKNGLDAIIFLVILWAIGSLVALCLFLDRGKYLTRPSKFIARQWTLRAGENGLVYEAGAFSPWLDPFGVERSGQSWSVTVDQIARVESGLTTEWQFMREYDGGGWLVERHQPIPKAEFQTFLYLNDGSRRVILTANADREGCGTLAASIRMWLEDVRGKANRSVPIFDEGFAL